jgi:hypothetical protein
MSMEYIRDAYGVPAKRGGRVKFTGGDAETTGTITGARGHYLRIRLDGHKRTMSYHPTWEIEYTAPNDQGSGAAERDVGEK